MRITQAIQNEYRHVREEALAGAAERRRAAEAAIPALAEYEAEKQRLAYELGFALRTAADKQALREQTRAAIAAADEQIDRLLAAHGLARDYLAPHFRCPACEDTGYVGAERRMCACLHMRLMKERYASSGLAENARFEAFDTSIFQDDAQRRRSLRAKEICEEYAQNLSYNGAKGLLLMGDVGLGKTYLLDCVGARALSLGRSVQKYTAYNLIDAMMRKIKDRGETRRGAEEITAAQLAAPDLLIIDDLGTEPVIANITFELLFSAVNERQNANKATAIATNLSREEILSVYGERLFSRMTSARLFSVLELKGKSLR